MPPVVARLHRVIKRYKTKAALEIVQLLFYEVVV